MFEVKVEAGEAMRSLARLTHSVNNLSPLMREIVAALHYETEENFATQGRHKWHDLADSTKARRAKLGKWPGMMLQVDGQLAGSISTSSDSRRAVIGSNKVYAAMQQFGGKKSTFSNLWGDIPARPYLPIDDAGNLQPEAEIRVLDVATRYLRDSIV